MKPRRFYEVTMDKPTREQVAAARNEVQLYLNSFRYNAQAVALLSERYAMGVLIAITAPNDPLPDPRPDDMVELARQVAKELRKRGIWAEQDGEIVVVPRRIPPAFPRKCTVIWHNMYAAQFNNLGPRAIADMIQAEEARKAQEWAGDE